MNRLGFRVIVGVAGLVLLGMTATLADSPAGSEVPQVPDTVCALPSESWGIPAALDAAITGPADVDRACMRALLIPDASIMSVSLGVDGAPEYRVETLDEWIARVKARGHVVLEEKRSKFRIADYGDIAHIWSSYTLFSDGKQVVSGINSIQAIKGTGGWRVTSILVQAELATEPLPKDYLPYPCPRNICPDEGTPKWDSNEFV